MKKYFVIGVFILAIASPLVSCKKFLDEKQVANLTQDYYKNENGLEALINGLYVISRVKHEWDGLGTKLIEPESDAYMHVDPNFARYTSAAYGNSVSSIASNVTNLLGAANAGFAPMGVYPHINNCNIALDVIDNIKPGKFATNDAIRRTRRGEILLLRAWALYLVSNQLGDVPMPLTPTTQVGNVFQFPKAKLEDIYTQIIGDVRYAYDNLPATASDRGRITKAAAGHFLAKLYLHRAQAAAFQNSGEQHLKMLYKGNVATDLDSTILIATQVITSRGGASGLAPDYWTLFDPKVSESSPHPEVLWAAQFDINTAVNGRFTGNRSANYHTGDYTNQTGVVRSMAYGRPFATYKPTDWAYDNFNDKVHDSRYYKTFQYEYIHNGGTSYTWNDASAAWWNANKPAGEPAVTRLPNGSWPARSSNGRRALIYIENQREEALDSAAVMSQPYQFLVRWVRSATTGRFYYRLNHNQANMGLATPIRNIFLSSKKYVDPMRGGSSDEANFNSEAGTRDAILMRLAETFLIRAEAYGRKGMYGLAVADINVVRQRAAYKNGEARPNVLVQWEPQASSLAPSELQAPFTASGTSGSRLTITEAVFTPGTIEAQRERYIPNLGSKDQMFIHFIYNEKAREFLSEGIAWEDLHNAGILYERIVYLNQMASPLNGLWPVAFNTDNGNGQNGNGKGQMRKEYTFRPWPNAYLVQLTDANGKPLDPAAMAAYQNPGY